MDRSLIVALDMEWGMGNRGSDRPMPVYVPEDLNHFKETTTNNTLLVGRKTYETFPKQPFKDRHTIMLSTRDKDSLREKYGSSDRLSYANSLDEGLRIHEEKHDDTTLYVAGGREVYKQSLQDGVIDEAVISRFPTTCDCDMRFPRESFASYGWTSQVKEERDTSANNFGTFTIERYERR